MATATRDVDDRSDETEARGRSRGFSPRHQRAEDLHDRSLGELLRDLSEQTTRLIQQEIALANAEMSAKGKQVGAGAGMLSGAGLLGIFAFAAFTAMFISILDTGMKFWVAALIVAVVYALIAGVLAVIGRNRIRSATPVAPEQAIQSSKEDIQWAKTQAQSGMR